MNTTQRLAQFSQPGDTLKKIALDNLGYNCSEKTLNQYMAAVVEVNQNNGDIGNPFFRWPSLASNPEMASMSVYPYKAFWLPDFDSKKHIILKPAIKDLTYNQNFLPIINRAPVHQRKLMFELSESNMQMNHGSAMSFVGKLLYSNGGPAMFGATISVSAFEHGADASSDFIQGVHGKLVNINATLKLIKTSTGAERGALQSQFIKLHRSFTADINSAVGKRLMHTDKGIVKLTKRHRLYKMVANTRARDFDIVSTEEAKDILDSAKYFRFLSYAGMGAEGALAYHEVHEAYVNKEDWVKPLLEEGEGFSMGQASALSVGDTGVAIAAALGIELTPVGWVLTLTAGAVLAGAVGMHYGKEAIDFIYKHRL